MWTIDIFFNCAVNEQSCVCKKEQGEYKSKRMLFLAAPHTHTWSMLSIQIQCNSVSLLLPVKITLMKV